MVVASRMTSILHKKKGVCSLFNCSYCLGHDMLISSFSDVFSPEVRSSTQNVTGLIVTFIVLAIVIYSGSQFDSNASFWFRKSHHMDSRPAE